jgi:protein-S-isoprenylcysteine O-methyltransferase Ste14
MFGLIAALYGGVVYLIFFAVFVYTVGFVGNFAVPKSIDSGAGMAVLPAVVVNLLLLTVFAAQHSIMARPAFKRWWTRFVPKAVERSTYVLLAALALALLCFGWQPLPAPIWTVANQPAAAALQAVFWLGWLIVFGSTFLINHFELFGLRQVHARLVGREIPPPRFRTPLLYRWVRHPLYLGFLLAFWATPTMTLGHLLFAAGMTGYILLGIALEERDLIAQFGDQYRHYRASVGMLLPWSSAASSKRLNVGTEQR